MAGEPDEGTSDDPLQAGDRDAFMGEVVASTLEPVAAGLAVLFLAVAGIQRFAMEPPFPGVMAPYSVGMSLVFAGIYAGIRRRGIPPRWAHPVGTGFVLLVLTGTVLPFALIQDPLQTTDLVLVAVGTGAVFVSRRWYLANLAVVGAVFGGFVAANPGYARWPNLGVAVLSGSVLGYVVLRHRASLLEDVHELRAQDTRQRRTLEERMARIEDLREEAERERDRARRYAGQLEETNEDLRRFAETVSRHLEDPVERARRRLEDSPGEGGLADAAADLREVETTLGSLVEYAGVAAHDTDLEAVDLGTVLGEAWRGAARRHEAEIHPPDMGELPEVVGDADLLVRLFEELLDNALRHGEPPITVFADGSGGTVEVVVEDDGPGVDADDRDRIFRLLEGRAEGRPGVGLALCRRIAQDLGGAVGHVPAEDTGARFVVTLQGVGRISAAEADGAEADLESDGPMRRVGDRGASGQGRGPYPSSSGA